MNHSSKDSYSKRRAFRLTPATVTLRQEEARRLWQHAKLKDEVQDISPLFRLPDEKDPQTRSYLVDAAGILVRKKKYSDEILPILATCLDSGNQDERYAAVSAIADHASEYGDIKKYVDLLVLRLSDQSDKIRMATVRALRMYAARDEKNALAIAALLPKHGENAEMNSVQRLCRSSFPPGPMKASEVRIKDLKSFIGSLSSQDADELSKAKAELEKYVAQGPENARRVAGLLLLAGITNPEAGRLHEKCRRIISPERDKPLGH